VIEVTKKKKRIAVRHVPDSDPEIKEIEIWSRYSAVNSGEIGTQRT
jgi:hypothetical protein